MSKQKTESQDVVARASAMYEELVGVVQGGWVGALDPAGFVLGGDRDMRDGQLCVKVLGHASLTSQQWKSWVIGSLVRAGSMADVAEKIWEAGIQLVDLTSFGSVGRANKPYATAMVMFLDDLLLHAQNLALHPVAVMDFQKRIADKQFTSLDLLQLLRGANPIAGKGIGQTGGDLLYKKDTVTGYGSL